MNALTKITNTANYNFSSQNFAPELSAAASEQFPLREILRHIGIQDPDAMTHSEIKSHRIQTLNSVFSKLSVSAFSGLRDVDNKRSPLSIDGDLTRKKMELDGLKVTSSNGGVYFCANLKVIREAVEDMHDPIIHDDVEVFATAIQKFLVSQALKTNKPVMFVLELIEETDKMVIYKSDRYLHRNANYAAITKANELALRG